MAYPLSERLNAILDFSKTNPDDETSLCSLRFSVAKQFGDKQECALALLKSSDESMRHGRLMFYLIKTIGCDSVVRDILTVGHLAKLLSRVSLLSTSADYELLGLPNRLFDEFSQKERADYFERHSCLPMSGSLVSNSLMEKICADEKEILTRFRLVDGSQ